MELLDDDVVDKVIAWTEGCGKCPACLDKPEFKT
jgi:hypothetical protein